MMRVDVAVLVLVVTQREDKVMNTTHVVRHEGVDVAVLVLVVTQRDGDVMTSER